MALQHYYYYYYYYDWWNRNWTETEQIQVILVRLQWVGWFVVLEKREERIRGEEGQVLLQLLTETCREGLQERYLLV